MQFIKNLFKDNSIVGLSSLKKREEHVKITIPESYKKTNIFDVTKNYILI